ncbi:MAG TPA: PQQ-binding-like beta-propeller repeat protein, partial [Acidobacteriota bacterium]
MNKKDDCTRWLSAGVFALFLLHAVCVRAENWPGWRGPRRDGTSIESAVPLKWSRTENVLWRLPLPGPAASTPIIWGDRIFLTSPDKNNLLLICVSVEGKVLWKRVAGAGNSTVKGDEGNFAAPSPATDGRHVWVFFGSGDLACFDFEGNEIWKTNLQQRYGRFNLYFVMASTPLVDGNRIYLQLLHTDA